LKQFPLKKEATPLKMEEPQEKKKQCESAQQQLVGGKKKGCTHAGPT